MRRGVAPPLLQPRRSGARRMSAPVPPRLALLVRVRPSSALGKTARTSQSPSRRGSWPSQLIETTRPLPLQTPIPAPTSRA